MSTSDVVSAIISFLALVISGYTAYKTILARFGSDVILKPRVALTNFKEGPSIVVGCDIANLGAKSGSIDDFVLLVKYRQQSSKSINSLSFLPLLIRDDYSVFKNYVETDFEPFQSISLPKQSKTTKYIVFVPSDGKFSPSAGDIELQIYFRDSNASGFSKVKRVLNFSVNAEAVKIWGSPTGQSVLLESQENDKFREKLMESIF